MCVGVYVWGWGTAAVFCPIKKNKKKRYFFLISSHKYMWHVDTH